MPLQLRMRYLRYLWLLVLLAPCAHASGGYVVVQSKVCAGVDVLGQALDCTFTSSNTLGNTIIAVSGGVGLSAVGSVISDNINGAYIVAANGSQTRCQALIAYFPSVTAGTPAVHLFVNASSAYAEYLWIMEVSGTDASTAVNAFNSSTSTTSTGNAVTGVANTFIVSVGHTLLDFSSTPASSWTDGGGGTWVPLLANQSVHANSSQSSGHAATQIVSSTGTYFNTMTANGITPTLSVSAIAAFTIGSAPNTAVHHHRAQVIRYRPHRIPSTIRTGGS